MMNRAITLFKTIIPVLLLVVTISVEAQEVKNGLTWYTDITKVQQVSEKTKKPVFAFFTGSDWCGWCHRLQAAVFNKQGFKEWAKQNVILLELDYPRTKQLPAALAKQNAELQQFFQVQGYPTVWLFYINKDAKTGKFNISGLGSLGYPRAEPGKEETTFITNANAILKNK